MRLFEAVPEVYTTIIGVSKSTINACFHVAHEPLHWGDACHMESLAVQFGGIEELETARSRILASVPAADEFGQMLTVVRDQGIEVSADELTQLVSQGKLPRHPVVDMLAEVEGKWRREHEEREAFVKASLSRGESLAGLLEELGIKHMRTSEWSDIRMEELDSFIKRYSTGEHQGSQFLLRHAPPRPAQLSGAVTSPQDLWSQTLWDENVEPWWCAADGTRYTFLDVAFYGGSIAVKTRIEQDGVGAREDIYTVATLRSMIGLTPAVEPKTRQRPSWFRRLGWLR
jgi:hypothetical protein